MKKLAKIILTVLTLAALAGLVFYFEDQFKLAFFNLNRLTSHCDRPIEYYLGELDERFGLSREELKATVAAAAGIWQAPVNKQLFVYAEKGSLEVNLLYDERQAATDKLKKLGLSISSDRATYDNLKNKYETFNQAYQRQKSELDNTVGYYNQRKSDYEDEVKEANRRGGARPAEYAILEEERRELNRLAEAIAAKQAELNKTVDDLNATASVINRLIRQLNLTVSNYNTVGAAAAGEFQEGEYISDASGERINVYQFDDRQALVRVLAHELGHALGLEHVDDPKAIMYRLNEAGNDELAADDLSALKAECRIK